MAERTGPGHCDFQSALVIITGVPFGSRYTNATNDREYVRDPENVFGAFLTSIGFDPDADLPADAVDSGLREGDRALWVVPADDSTIYLVTGTTVESWPLDPEPAGCA